MSKRKNPFIREDVDSTENVEADIREEFGFQRTSKERSDISASVGKRVESARPLFSELLHMIKWTVHTLFTSKAFKMMMIGGMIGLILAAFVKVIPLHIGFGVGAALNLVMSWGKDLSIRNDGGHPDDRRRGGFYRH